MSTLKELIFGVDYSKMPYNELCDLFHKTRHLLKHLEKQEKKDESKIQKTKKRLDDMRKALEKYPALNKK